MDNDKYKNDLKEIREMMSRSSRFISLSGLSGVFAGMFSLLGAYAAYRTIYEGQSYSRYGIVELRADQIYVLLGIALVVITGSIITGIYFTRQRAQNINQKLWDKQTKRYLINLAIPLVTGGLLCFILLLKGYVSILAPLTLIFYGLALVNGSHFTLRETKSLGLIEIALGLIGICFIGYGLFLWAIGFGLLHIIYGTYMQIQTSKVEL